MHLRECFGSRLRQQVLRGINRALKPARVQLIHAGQLEALQTFHETYAAPLPPEQPMDPGLSAYLATNGDRIHTLRDAYADVQLDASAWSDDKVAQGVALKSFRSDNMFVFQARGTSMFQYLESARYVRRADRLGLVDRLTEDGAFGATRVDADGWSVSRDLLDSILEINFLDEAMGLTGLDHPVILDIGAGYGRLAHRLTEAVPGVRYLCTDGVPMSTFTLEFYLSYRGVAAGAVIPLHEVGALGPADGISLAINIHSFPEMPMSTSGWWISHLARCEVPRFFLVTDGAAGTTALEADGRRHGDFTEQLQRHGYELVVKRPKYDDALIDPIYQLFPADYWLFERTP